MQQSQQKLEKELHELKTLSKHGQDFENTIQLLSNYADINLIRDKIIEYTGFTQLPSLLYEIVGHLLKHSFIDAVVNYNFDEILDCIIDEELGTNNYKRVISDGDCRSLDELIVDGRLKIPIYIKPHGSISHPASMRFTKRQYLDMPNGIEYIMTQLIKGYRGVNYNNNASGGKIQENKGIERVNLILIGFTLASVELNELLENFLPPYSKIYHLQYEEIKNKEHYINSTLEGLVNRIKLETKYAKPYPLHENGEYYFERHKSLYKSIPISKFTYNKNIFLQKGYTETLTNLWRLVHYRFREPYQPRSISRHELISYFFENENQKIIPLDDTLVRMDLRNSFENSISYYLDRTIVEIAIALSRNDGIIDSTELLIGRAGYFYNLYRKTIEIDNKPSNEIIPFKKLLKSFSKYSDDTNSFSYAENIFAITKIDQKKDGCQEKIDIFRRKKYDNQSLKEESKIYSIIFHLFNNCYLSNEFNERLKNQEDKIVLNGLKFSNDKKKYSNTNVLNEIIRCFCKSNKTHYYHIQPNYFDPKNFLWETFEKKNICHTNLSFKYRFKDLFFGQNHEPEWDIFLSVLEQGSILEFFKNLFIEKGDIKKMLENKKIILLCSFESSSQKFSNQNIDTFLQKNLEDLKAIHSEYLISGFGGLEIHYVPYSLHNHHVNLFLKHKEIDKNNAKGVNANIPFKVLGSIYVYRRGFSNSINPISIRAVNDLKIDIKSLENDNFKMLSLFYLNYKRAIEFSKSQNSNEMFTGDFNMDEMNTFYKELEKKCLALKPKNLL